MNAVYTKENILLGTIIFKKLQLQSIIDYTSSLNKDILSSANRITGYKNYTNILIHEMQAV